MAAGESPKVTLSSPSQYSGLRLRCGMRIRELPEEHELLRRWCEGLDQEYRGQRLARRGLSPKLLKAKREVPRAAQRQEVLAVQQGLCALCGCTVTQSACELDHVVPVRQLFADSVQRLQALCVDCHSKKTLRESAQPTSLEIRVCPGVWRPTCAVRSCRRWSSRPRGATARSLSPQRFGPARPGAHGRCVARGRGAHGQALRLRVHTAPAERIRAAHQRPAGA